MAGEAALTPLGEAAQPLSRVVAVQDARQQREEVLARRVWAVAASFARVGQRALDAERRLPGNQLGQFPVYRFKMSKQPLSCGFMKQFTRPGGTR